MNVLYHLLQFAEYTANTSHDRRTVYVLDKAQAIPAYSQLTMSTLVDPIRSPSN